MSQWMMSHQWAPTRCATAPTSRCSIGSNVPVMRSTPSA
jgi:hypothetical protein